MFLTPAIVFEPHETGDSESTLLLAIFDTHIDKFHSIRNNNYIKGKF